VLSPSDTAYRLLKETPTGLELQELFITNLFELGFAGQNTRQPIPRLGLLLLERPQGELPGPGERLAEQTSEQAGDVTGVAVWRRAAGVTGAAPAAGLLRA
jgi:hypothetical protein